MNLDNYYYNSLATEEERRAYRDIYNKVYYSSPTCTCVGVNPDQIINVVNAITFDHPDLVNFNSLCLPMVRCAQGLEVSLNYLTFDNVVYQQLLDEFVRCIQCAASSNSEYDIVKAIYDKLAGETRYGFDALNGYIMLCNANASAERFIEFFEKHGGCFSPYGVIVEHEGVCAGIAEVFTLVCRIFNVNCTSVPCNVKSQMNIDHQINVVEIEGELYYVDVTGGLSQEPFNMVRYDTFLMSSDIAQANYVMKEQFDCQGERYNYFVMNKLCFQSVVSLRRYLQSYRYGATGGKVRFMYVGSESDNVILRLATDVLQMHCCDGFQLYAISVEKGYGMAVINN